uniref:Uncharacterized protein n=1 Tax=Anguilla anguilla TaxID=7936 RepID=A0A0E9PWR1_ANGAN
MPNYAYDTSSLSAMILQGITETQSCEHACMATQCYNAIWHF